MMDFRFFWLLENIYGELWQTTLRQSQGFHSHKHMPTQKEIPSAI